MSDGTESEVGLLEISAVIMLSVLFSIAGGNGEVALIQDQWVNNNLLAPALFAWAFAIGKFVPGPHVNFIAAVGYYLAGIPGAITAVISICIPTSLSASFASHWFARFRHSICRLTLAGTFVIAGMMTTAALSLGLPMNIPPIGIVLIVVVIATLFFKSVDPIIIIAGCAVLGAMTWWLEQP